VLDLHSPEAFVERLFHEPPLEYVRQAVDWHVVPAIHGRGTLLIGPLISGAGNVLKGSVAIAPPGVFLRTDASASEELSRRGWRLATWASEVKLDQQRPIDHRRMTLAEAVSYVEARDSTYVEWMRAVVRAQLDVLLGLTRPDSSGQLPAAADRACHSLNELAATATAAFGDRQEIAYVETQLRPDRELFLQAARSLADAP